MRNTNGIWTEDKVAQLKKLFAEGLTDQQISLRLKVSRMSVLGKRNRLGLHREQPVKPPELGKPVPRCKVWSGPDPKDPDHVLDARDLRILDAVAAGGDHAAVAKQFKLPESYVDEIWRVRQGQDPVGEDA